MTSKNQQNI